MAREKGQVRRGRKKHGISKETQRREVNVSGKKGKGGGKTTDKETYLRLKKRQEKKKLKLRKGV